MPGNQLVKKVSGPYRRYAVTFITNPKELNWTVTPDGAHHCTLEFMTFVYDGDGTRINVQVNGIGAAIPGCAIRQHPERQYQILAADQRSRKG